MKDIKPTQKIEFANSLRGIAVLMVLLGHYIFVFNALKGKYSGFPALDYYPYPWAFSILSPFPINQVNVGQIAVALFFLISGLVIPNSTASLGNKKGGQIAFIIGRLLRIWPTYIVGLTVSVSALWFNSYINSSTFNITFAQIISNMTIFRDWLGQSHIDGIIWTLEIEVKFYIFVLLFWKDIREGKLYPIAIITIIACILAPMGANFDVTNDPTLTISNFIWTAPYLMYMSMGILFNYHYRKMIDTKTLLASISAIALAFVYTAKTQALYIQVPASYISTLCVFTFLYFFAKEWTGGPAIRFFAKISYPLYVSHAALGYTGIAFMISRGLSPMISLILQIAISTAVAFIIHILVENPTHNLGKRLGKLFIKRNEIQKSDPSTIKVTADS